MANREATLILRMKDLASSGLAKTQSAFTAFRATLLGVTAAVTGLVGAMVVSLKAYAEEEAAINKLETALKNQGLEVASTSRQLQAYAAELQKTTTFEDDLIIETQAMLTTFGLTGKTLNQATAAALDLSKGLGIDLKTATMLMGKAAVGETSTLSRFGLKIDENVPKSERLAEVLDKVNSRFGGSAQAALTTVTGKLENMTNRISDLKERIGSALLPVFDFWLKQMDRAVSLVDRLTKSESDEARGRELTIIALEKQKNQMIENAEARARAMGSTVMLNAAEMERLQLITDSIVREKQLLAQETEGMTQRQEQAVTNKLFMDELKNQKDIEDEEARIKELTTLDAQTATILGKHQTRVNNMSLLQTKFTQSQSALLTKHLSSNEQQELVHHINALEEHKKFNDAQMVMDQALRAAQEQENEMRKQNFASTMSFISTLATEKNKTLATVGKAGAISMATIDTFAAANKALASAPPPFNFALMGAVVAAGLANVAKISGIKLAEGGVVMPRAGGTTATIGEAGQPEAVIPLDDERAQSMIGGNSVEIHIHAGTIVADEMSIRRFAERLDVEFFRLQRNKKSVAFG